MLQYHIHKCHRKSKPSYLAEGALADERVDLVAVEPLLARTHDVVVVVVVVALVVLATLLLVALVFVRRRVRPTLLLRVVHLKADIKCHLVTAVI